MAKNKDILIGTHSIEEAIESGVTINKILVKKGLEGKHGKLLTKARSIGIMVQHVPIEKLNRIYRGPHQGMIAQVSPVAYHDLSQVVLSVFERGETPFFVMLDGITDVRNFGAIARTAECAGAHGIIIPARGGVFITEDAVKTSAGALNSIPVCKVDNLETSVEYLKQSGLFIVSLSEKAQDVYYKDPDMFTAPLLIVMGSEEKGISSNVVKKSDRLVKIPMVGNIASLNVSVAFGIMAFETVKMRT